MILCFSWNKKDLYNTFERNVIIPKLLWIIYELACIALRLIASCTENARLRNGVIKVIERGGKTPKVIRFHWKLLSVSVIGNRKLYKPRSFWSGALLFSFQWTVGIYCVNKDEFKENLFKHDNTWNLNEITNIFLVFPLIPFIWTARFPEITKSH